MKKLIFFFTIIAFGIHIANSQTTHYSFENGDTVCHPTVIGDFFPTHGSPRYAPSPGSSLYNNLAIRSIQGEIGDGAATSYHFEPCRKYRISVKINSPKDQRVGLALYAVYDIVVGTDGVKSKSYCDPGQRPDSYNNMKQKICDTSFTSTDSISFIDIDNFSIDNFISNRYYMYFWVTGTPLCPQSTTLIEYIQISKLGAIYPSVPTNLRAASVSSDNATIAWDASMDNAEVGGYNIYINGSLYDQTTYTQYTLFNLQPCTHYSFSVSAYNKCGYAASAQTSAINVQTTSANAPVNVVLSSPVTITSSAHVVEALNNITMKPGFSVKPPLGKSFIARIGNGCGARTKNAMLTDEETVENTETIIPVANPISAYPNPTSGIINIKYSDFKEGEKAIVTDFLGKVILETPLTAELTSVDLSSFPNGVYLVKVVNGKNISLFKVIKK